jgi:hypothetical protein
MLRDIFAYSYSPNICVRPAEMRALEELPEHDKDSMFPLFLLSPWANSKKLSSAVERIAKAYGEREYFLGVDRYYIPKDPTKDVAKEFLDILDPTDGFEKYFDFIQHFEKCIPVVDVGCPTLHCFLKQIERAELLGRGFLFHIHDRNTPIGDDRFRAISNIGHNNFAFYIDKGWNFDPLTEELWYRGICQQIFAAKERAAVIVCSASFPRDFTVYDGVKEVQIGTRKLSRQIKIQFNNYKIIHGDWASTKPRSYKIASPPLPRIDFALRDKWIVARSKEHAWDFQIAAKKLIESDNWIEDLNVWGTFRIKETAAGLPYAIESAPAASAARINIHLHVQSHYDEPDIVMNTDDPWIDL